MSKKHIWYVQALVQVPVVVQVVAEDEQEAFAELNDHHWYKVHQEKWQDAQVNGIGDITQGPGINIADGKLVVSSEKKA